MPVVQLPRHIRFGLGSLALGLLLAGCGESPPRRFEPLRYDYLTILKLNVGRVDVDDAWTPRGLDGHVEFLAPTPPLDALRQMEEDRLVPGGTSGRAMFTIDDATIIRQGGTYRANFAVRLDVLNDDGQRQAGIMAHATGTLPVSGDDREEVRSDLNDLTRKTMDDMNVDFEYQIRHALRDDLQTTSPSAPPPPPVDTQDLNSPGSPPSSDAPPPSSTEAPPSAITPPPTDEPPPTPLDAPSTDTP